MVAAKREDRKRGLFLILGSLGVIALIALASAFGWIEGGTTLAGSEGDVDGLTASGSGGSERGSGSEGGVALVGAGLGAGPAELSGSADRGCLLGFICVDSSAEAGENQAKSSVDEDGANVDN